MIEVQNTNHDVKKNDYILKETKNIRVGVRRTICTVFGAWREIRFW